MGNWGKIEFICTTKLGTNLLVLDQLEFWRVEQMLQNYQNSLEQEKKYHEKQQKEQEKQNASVKTPSMSDFKLPTMNMPKMK